MLDAVFLIFLANFFDNRRASYLCSLVRLADFYDPSLHILKHKINHINIK